MKTIRIDRKKWLRGKEANSNGEFVPSYLWCPDRQAGCCLGHAIHQTTNCAWKDLAGKSVPSSHYARNSFLTYLGPDGLDNNNFADEAMTINDAPDISEALREEGLIELFAENNIKLEFYN